MVHAMMRMRARVRARLVMCVIASASLGCASPEPHLAVTGRAVQIASDSGVLLAGTFVEPAVGPTAERVQAPTRVPTVLLLSGSGPQDRDGSRADLAGYAPFRDIADALSARGVAVLRLDDRGTGASSGQFAGATTYDFAHDAAAALRWLRAQSVVDTSRLIVLGHSEGALVALLVAAQDRALDALVLLGAPARSGRELARWQRAALVGSDAAAWPPTERGSILARADAEAERTAATDPWMRVWFDLDPREVARRVRQPVLVLHGANDRQVPVGDAALLSAALRAAGDRDVSVRRFPSTNHLFLEDSDGDPRGYVRLSERQLRDDVVQAIVEWVTRRGDAIAAAH